MESVQLLELADGLLAEARAADNGRRARTLFGRPGHRLRQTLLALAAGQALGEHNSPGEATLQVVRGQVRLDTGGQTWTGTAGDVVLIPPDRHDLVALEDSAVLLTVANDPA